MSTSTDLPIGLEELLLEEPRDETGKDAMPNRVGPSVLVGPNASDGAGLVGLQPADYTSFGAWVRNRREHDRKAQFLYALWQQSARPVRPKPRKALNRDSLASIASKMAEVQLSKANRANGVVAACTTNQQFYETVLSQLKKCDRVSISRDSASLDGPHLTHLPIHYPFSVDGDLFVTLCGLAGPVVFPEVHSDAGFAESTLPKLSGIERLSLHNSCSDISAEKRLKQLLEKNKNSLKVLKMHASMLSFIPAGLRLEEFSCTDPDEVPLQTKVFKCEYICNTFSLPPPFIRTVSAEEIHIEARDIHQHNSTDALLPKTSNPHVKKLIITLPPIELTNLAQLFEEVASMCPQLECFELVQDSKFYTGGHDRVDLADQLAANIQGVMEQRSFPFRICLKMNVLFVAQSWPVASDFARRVLDADLQQPEVLDNPEKTLMLFREKTVGTKTLRVDCELHV